MNKFELFILDFTGKLIQILGGLGFAFTLYFDKFAGRANFELGKLEFLGLCVFGIVIIFGFVVEIFLLQIKNLILSYLNK